MSTSTAIRSASLLCLLVSLVSAQDSERRQLTWPEPPDQARIRYEMSIRGPGDLGIERSLFRKILDFVLGVDADEVMLVQPMGVAVDLHDRLFIADPGASCVHIFDLTNKEYRTLGSTSTAVLAWPVGVAVAPDGRVYVSDAVRKEVLIYKDEGDLEASVRYAFVRPTGLTIVRDRLYVVDSGQHRVFVFRLDGEFLFSFGRRGSEPGEFNYPGLIAADTLLAVVDAMNHRVQVLSDSGLPLLSVGRLGDVQGSFASPKGVAIDTDGHLYVTDALFDAVQLFDREGRLLLVVGRSGEGPGEFQNPSGIAIDRRNRIFVVDTFNRRVQIFQRLAD